MVTFIFVICVLMLLVAFIQTKQAFDGILPTINIIMAACRIGLAVWGFALIL